MDEQVWERERERIERELGWKCFVYIICGWLAGSLLYSSRILYFYIFCEWGSWDGNWEHFSTLNKEQKKPLSSLNEREKEQKENILNNITWLLNIFQCYVIICLMKLFSFSCQEKKAHWWQLCGGWCTLLRMTMDGRVGIAYFYRWMDF